jgi:hypothetical protein
MLVSEMLIPIPSRHLLVDLILSDGSDSTESLSPYRSAAHEFFQQIPNAPSNALSMLEANKDYNADKQRPEPGTYRKRQDLPSTYLRRLEEIDESWVFAYLVNALTGMKINQSDGLHEYEQNNAETRTIQGSDGNTADEKDFLTQSGDYSPSEILSAAKKLPYLLKRLHMESIDRQVNLLSLIIAYERAKTADNNYDPKPRHILNNKVYRMFGTGRNYSLMDIDDNKGKIFPQANRWIHGDLDARDTYFYTAMELLDVCETLGIDLKQEDSNMYQQDFIDSLTVTYLAPNKMYVLAKHNKGSIESSKSYLDVYDTGKSIALSEEEAIQNTIQVYLDSSLSRDGESIDGRDLETFMRLYNQMRKCQYNLRYFFTVDGFFYVNRSMVFTIDISGFCSTLTRFRKALVHSDGFAIIITENNWFYYQRLDILSEYIKDCISGTVGMRSYGNNWKHGFWREGFV